ncbi:hypothetical protein EDB84DRAFT_539211 [Lactarius hengduanensis]|nr:hypothetical protein EDB84DRAFT_539211 [Lactarius hengduanensis]
MSFMSMEPQSREALETQSKCLLTLFDSHLKIIADRYLAFFQKRRRIEEEYITSLRKLHREANVVDASFDSRAEPTPTRAAMGYTQRGSRKRYAFGRPELQVEPTTVAEASTREAFVSSLDIDVIKPLATLKEAGDRTRKRIDKNLRNSAADYAGSRREYNLEAQQAYLKKYPPVDHSHSTTSFQHVPSRRFGVNLFRNRRELDRAEFEEPGALIVSSISFSELTCGIST